MNVLLKKYFNVRVLLIIFYFPVNLCQISQSHSLYYELAKLHKRFFKFLWIIL